jgi:proteasome lid subunit RPN8/RPN11
VTDTLVRVEQPADWDSELLRALYELAFSTPDREVAGVLVGSIDEGAGPLPSQVRAAIPATQGFTVGQASLFGHQTWAQVYQAMADHYGGLEVVGWYVSRPGHGTEPTETDVVNHQRWFARPDQLLLLVDSLSHRAAVYGWGTDGLRQITEGPIARRFTHPPRLGFPMAAAAMLAVIGVVVGALAYLLAQVIGG